MVCEQGNSGSANVVTAMDVAGMAAAVAATVTVLAMAEVACGGGGADAVTIVPFAVTGAAPILHILLTNESKMERGCLDMVILPLQQ